MTKLSSPFVKQASFEVEYAPAHITKWKSQRTGLQLTYINQPSPVVNGYFAVATEIQDNSGCPHTLEHLVFMGSKKYPFKGLLDALGNRLYSQTNAWTAVDQTVYTLTTAGWEGFKTLLPIYLDHLFNPTLTDEACLTEVYHIDGNGKEKGVVFSEMQGIESQSWFTSFKAMQETLYSPKSGYSSETGGLMAELRHLKSDQIREFHKAMYRPDNLCVVITGSINQDELLNIMTEFDSELEALPAIPNKRPFVDSEKDPLLLKSVSKVVEFPEKDESTGELLMSWIGPKGDDVLINTAVDMVGTYFTDSPISLFNKQLVEVENPFATDIEYSTDDYFRTALNFTCNGVPVEKLKDLELKMKELLKSQTEPDNMNLLYTRQIINQQRLKFISQTEKSPSTFSNVAILDFIYGNPDGSDLAKWTQNLNEYDELLTWTSEQWCDVINEYFVKNHSATILAKPSAKLNQLHKEQNKSLSKKIKEKYGADGLKLLAQGLTAAQEKNDMPIPDNLLTEFKKPDPSKIAFIKTDSYRAGLKGVANVLTSQYVDDEFSAKLKDDTPSDFPLFIHFENFKSQFTTIQLVMSSARLKPHLLKYMSIIEEIFSMSIQLPDGKYIPYETVIADLNRDLIEFQLDNGYDYQFLELICMMVKFETKNYHRAIQWLYNITHYVKFEEARVKVIIEKIINSLPDKKRNGELMMYSSQFRNLFTDRSLRKGQDAMHTEQFFKELLEDINNGGFDKIAQDLEEIKTQLFSLDNIKVIIMGNTADLDNPVSSWNEFVATTTTTTTTTNDNQSSTFNVEPFNKLPRSFNFRSDLGLKCAHEAHLIDIPATESTHLVAATKIPTDYLDDDVPIISLAIEFLCAVEGPFWRAIRGTGLAYGVNMKKNLEMGYLTFSIYRGADPKQAWVRAKEIVSQYALGELEIDRISLDSAIASIVNALANSQESSSYAASFKVGDNLFKERGPNYTEMFLQKLNNTTAEDVVIILKEYFINLFDANHSVVFTSLPLDKVKEIGDFFHEQGYNINVESIEGAADCDSCEEEDEEDEESGEDSGEESGETSEEEDSEED
ncbi:conserved hypothetical protein [Lodderomyces elongisporus NRRL YB-4239]|uniref:Zinc metalloprotease n=1 Tax=Lodderomyces elongisporus (strain ATCC 11503 / CBS 2605 / JCM 1781 / NBRC 1676 / NRRL YB-4239) TaxID=379508 RepID=A5E6E1_LODEL|nr:conserved hypothetical protein [Lodderomyces elongisporus NRRL YB-4239]